jgi:hypothetical protein
MAAIGEVAKKRRADLEDVLEALGVEGVLIPGTKVDPIVTEAFYVDILANLAKRVVNLECSRIGHTERLGALGEAVAVLLKREDETDEAKADELSLTPPTVQGRR